MQTFKLICLLAISHFYVLNQAIAQDCTTIGTNAGELPTVLVDVFKSSRTFWETDLTNYIWDTGNPLTLDANGYPTSVNAGYGARTLLMEALEGNYPTGNYTLLYDGEGTIELGMDAQNAVFTNNGGTNNRIDFEIPSTTNEGIMVDITATTVGNHIHNIRIIRPDESGTNFLATYQTQHFIPAFYNQLQNYQIIRFMDWQATNWSEQEFWANRPTLQSASWAFSEGKGGVPVEVMVQVANAIDADPWFCMPHRATDNYMTQFANYVAANLESSQKAYIEYSNEVWNDLFSDYDALNGQATYAHDRANSNGVTGWAEELGYWVGRRSGEMFDLWSAAFGDDSRLVKVIPIQTGTGLSTPFTLDYDHNGTPLWQMADAVAGAGYFEGGYQDLPLATMTVDELLDEIEAHMYDFDSGPYWAEQTVDMLNGAPYNANPLPFICYEGGQHLANWAGTPEDPVTALLIAANRHPRMGEIYTDYLDWWRDHIGGAFVHFHSLGTYSMWGSWGELEYITQDPATSPKYMALQNWIAANPEPCNLVALPVELTNFSGFPKNNTNVLEWKTAAEINLDYIEIERRDIYENEFQTIGKVNARAVNEQGAAYQFIDKAVKNPLYYYRLKNVDVDGSVSFSPHILIENKGNVRIRLLPNLVVSTTQFVVESQKSQLANLSILNTHGVVLKTYQMPLNKGLNQLKLQLEDLPSGIYFLNYAGESERQTIRFLKQ